MRYNTGSQKHVSIFSRASLKVLVLRRYLELRVQMSVAHITSQYSLTIPMLAGYRTASEQKLWVRHKKGFSMCA